MNGTPIIDDCHARSVEIQMTRAPGADETVETRGRMFGACTWYQLATKQMCVCVCCCVVVVVVVCVCVFCVVVECDARLAQ